MTDKPDTNIWENTPEVVSTQESELVAFADCELTGINSSIGSINTP